MNGKKSGPSMQDRDVTSIRKMTQEGKVSEALTQALEIEKQNTNSPIVHHLLGDIYAQMNKWELSISSYQKAVRLDPNEVILHPKLARVYLLSGLTKEAEEENKLIDRFIIEGPHTREFFIEVANLYTDFRELDVPPKKMIIIGQALQNKFAPDSTSGQKLEALGLILLNQPEEAIKILEKARTLDPKDNSVLQYLVYSKIKVGDTAGAQSLVDIWIQDAPKATQPLLIVAHWKFESKAYAEAVPYLDKIVQLSQGKTSDPILADALNLIGRIDWMNDKKAEAQVAFQRSCQMGFKPSCETPAPTETTPSNETKN
jgi:tetratricopeptide (TPR) repeat protein